MEVNYFNIVVGFAIHWHESAWSKISFWRLLVSIASWVFSRCGSVGCSLAVRRLHSAVAPLGVQQGLWDTGFRSCGSRALEHRLNSCEAGFSLLPDQGSSPCLLPWQMVFTTEPPGKPVERASESGLLSIMTVFSWDRWEVGAYLGAFWAHPSQSYAHSSPASTQKTQAGGAGIWGGGIALWPLALSTPTPQRRGKVQSPRVSMTLHFRAGKH